MTGEYTVRVWDQHVKYELHIRRNITIIAGDSGTGKTTLVSMLQRVYENEKSSATHLECDVPCIPIMRTHDWATRIAGCSKAILFFDENCYFTRTQEFAKLVATSDCYFVIISRVPLHNLSYSVTEIYGFHMKGKRLIGEQVYNEQYQLYGQNICNSGVSPDKVLTEDSGSGFQFFSHILGNNCISADGKSNMGTLIGKYEGRVLLIADGAAFGSDMGKIVELMKNHPDYHLYLPESFEWLLLVACIRQAPDLKNILDKPADYIESSKYISWERYFTHLLEECCGKLHGNVHYTKSKLDSFFLSESNVQKVLHYLKQIGIVMQKVSDAAIESSIFSEGD